MIEGIGSSSAAPTQVDNTLGQLGTDAFLQLLVAQLRYQNPLAPTDGAAMLQQTATFTQVETLQAIAEINQQLMGFQQVTMGLGLVGKEVDAITADGNPVTGEVTSMRFTVDGPFLRIDDGSEIPMENVVSVRPAASDGTSPPPVSEPPVTPPASEPPVSSVPPVSEPPITDPPASEPPVSEPPPAEPPAAEPPQTPVASPYRFISPFIR